MSVGDGIDSVTALRDSYSVNLEYFSYVLTEKNTIPIVSGGLRSLPYQAAVSLFPTRGKECDLATPASRRTFPVNRAFPSGSVV